MIAATAAVDLRDRRRLLRRPAARPVGAAGDGARGGSRREHRSARHPAPALHSHEDTTLDDIAALDRFLAGIEHRALQMARVATGNVDEALDIVQDAMLLLVKRYGDRGEQEWGPLFHRILQNRIRDWYRRQKVRNRLRTWLGGGEDDPADDMAGVPDPDGRDPAGELAGGQTLARVQQALHGLPLRQQQVFLLRAWEGLDVAETARALGIGQGSVKTHYSRAVHRLRELLGDELT